jgi:hypothetical protein
VPVSIGLWALAASTVSVPGALLLASASVLASMWRHPIALVTALPGAATLALAAEHDGAPSLLALALLAAFTVVRLWRVHSDDVVEGAPTAPTIAALGLGAWLVLAPETWAWVGAPGLESWGTGVVYALGATAAVAFAIASFTETPFTLPAVEVADPAYAPGESRWSPRAAMVALAILAIAGGWLVASAAS